MHFVADLHIHSRYARATSRELNLENLHKWAALKGVDVVGTGDFTHPLWFAELHDKLEPAEEGLYRLKAPLRKAVEDTLPRSCRREVRFLLSVEISSIYKRHGRTRKVHNLILLPELERAEALNRRLGAIGNIKADGRPILGLDSHDLLEIAMEVCPEVLFIPAHIWTPHFAVLGSESGFDSLEECFDDLLPSIFALETGLSSDPPMNSRLSALDRFAMVSSSDAHSAQKLAREATCFCTDTTYTAMYTALRDRDPTRFTGTLEFYPAEGKYHYDGHRKCDIRWTPQQTLQAGGQCPACGKHLTVGVLHRVERLADRAADSLQSVARPFEYIIPLPEVIGAALGMGPESKKVTAIYQQLLEQFGPELGILRTVPPEDVARSGEPLVAEALHRMRTGAVEIQAGYDGEYGTVRIFSAAERAQLHGQSTLFALPARVLPAGSQAPLSPAPASPPPPSVPPADTAGLDAAQRQAVEAVGGPVVVIAGPGAGKTRTLTQRIAFLLRQPGVSSEQIMAVTFTKRAAAEMRRRVHELLPTHSLEGLHVGTFHRLALDLMHLYRGVQPATVLDAWETRQLLETALHESGLTLRPQPTQRAISLAKAAGQHPADLAGQALLQTAYVAYQAQLAAYQAWDYDDILLECVTWLEATPTALQQVRAQFPYVLVDEFQDVNAVQYHLVRLLAAEGQGLFVIGDPDQAIYRFRGADPRYFRTLQQDFPQAQVLRLTTNYRSTQTIVQAATAVIAQNAPRQPTPLQATGAPGSAVQCTTAPSAVAEGIAVVRQISHMLGGTDMLQADQHATREEHTRSLSDFAVLVRTAHQAEILEQCFLQEGLPYRLVGMQGFLEAPRVRQVVAFGRCLLQPQDPLRVVQALAHEAWYPGEAALSAVRAYLRTPEASPLLADLALAVPAAAPACSALEAALRRYQPLVAASPVALLEHWQAEYGGQEDTALLRLMRFAERAASLPELLDTLVLGKDADYESTSARAPMPAEAVQLMTLHAAKGLEFPVVFLCGVEDGILPSRTRDASLEEERRLFYVGLTRARDAVCLSYVQARGGRGPRGQSNRSPFLAEIPAALMVEGQVELPRPAPRAKQLSLF